MKLTRTQKIAIATVVVAIISASIAVVAIVVSHLDQPRPLADFEISVSPMGGSVPQGGVAQTTITVRGLNG